LTLDSTAAIPNRLRRLLDKCHDDPSRFNDVFLGGPSFDPNPAARQYQHEICRSVVDYRTTVVYSGNMLGKDYTFARIMLWWLYTRRDSLVIVTGPTQQQIGSIVWKEVRRAIRRAPIPFGAHVTAAVQASPQQVNIGGGWQALGFSTKSVERASGQHGSHLLVLVIEGSGVEEEIWDAIESLGYDRLAINGNPIRAEGRFVDLIRQADKDRAEGTPRQEAVNAIKISSLESPDADKEKSLVGLADRTWLRATERQYGKGSLYYRSHVLAEIPEVSADALIDEKWLDWCTNDLFIHRVIPPGHPVHATRRIACDLGEGVGRDSSCVLVRDDYGVLDVTWGSALGLPEAAVIIHRKAEEWGVPVERITYDRAGLGKDFPLHLSRHFGKDAHKIQGYAGAGKPMSSEYSNLRSEAAWKMRRRIEPGTDIYGGRPHELKVQFAIPPGPYWMRLRQELKTLKYSLVGRKTKLMNKDDWALELGHSPDIADALLQSFAFTGVQ
jgi:hypothetical protein